MCLEGGGLSLEVQQMQNFSRCRINCRCKILPIPIQEILDGDWIDGWGMWDGIGWERERGWIGWDEMGG